MKKIKIIIPAIILCLLTGLAISYFAYGSTLLNPDSDKSVINILSTDKSNPIDILKIEKYKNYVAVLYTDPEEQSVNKYASHLTCFKKSKYYSNRYERIASSGGNQSEPIVQFIQVFDENEEKNSICFIADTESEETKCSVFEYDQNLMPVKKLDEIEVEQTDYIIVREYETEIKNNNIVVYDGSISMDDLTKE